MGNVFVQGQHLNSQDLYIVITDDNGQLIDPQEIAYSFFGRCENKDYKGSELYAVGQLYRSPLRLDTGQYYVGERINTAFLVGSYVVQWIARRAEKSPLEVLGEIEFSVIRES